MDWSVSADRERLLALLSIAWRRPATPDVLVHLGAAHNHWRRGDKALANLRLIVADLQKLDDPSDTERLRLAEYLLDEGLPPRDLMQALGLDTDFMDLAKYDPDQPRVPAGSGRSSGRWSSGSDGDALMAPFGAAGRAFLGETSADVIASLARFASRFSTPTAVLGALFIPTPNSGGITQGTLPNAPNIHFEQDGPAGTLRLATTAADGSEIMVAAQNRGGLYVDVATGQAIGRNLKWPILPRHRCCRRRDPRCRTGGRGRPPTRCGRRRAKALPGFDA